MGYIDIELCVDILKEAILKSENNTITIQLKEASDILYILTDILENK